MNTEKDKMLAGEIYTSNDPTLIKERIAAKKLLHKLNVKEFWMNRSTRKIIQELIPNQPGNLYIEPPFHCDYGYNLFCGSNVYFNVNCVVLDSAKVTIGNDVLIGPGTHIYTASHPLDFETRKNANLAKPVTIGDNCWIGGQVVICPGVTIGEGSVIGAGSVVTKNIPPHTIAAGNPARVIKNLKSSV